MLDAKALAVISGVSAHHLIFIHNEWHLKGATIILVHSALACSVYAIEASVAQTTHEPPFHSATLIALYLSSLFLSISIYRLFFHRLRSFPGPRLAALSKLWHVWKCRDSRGYLVLDDWNEQYGAFVRTGPNELTVTHPAIIEALDGPGSRSSRSDWYDLAQPRQSSILTRDKVMHKNRRQIWLHSLSSTAIRQYHHRVLGKVQALENLIASHESKPVMINEIMYWFAFDSMGDFAFSEDFGMLRKQEWHSVIGMFRSAIALLGPFGPAIWIPRIAFTFIPGLWRVKRWFEMLAFCDGCMEKRMKRKIDDRDISSWFIEDHISNSEKAGSDNWLSGDTATLIVAGSDTTAPTLIMLCYYLARYPEHAKKVYQELATLDVKDPNALAKLPHLNGVINETMRLSPSLLTFGTRITPPEGLMFEGTFIPGGTKVCAPRYKIGRLEAAYAQPNNFIPERWYSRPELVRDRRAFAPFGLGNTSCPGKNLALAQLRLVIAGLVHQYQIEFAPGTNNGESVLRDMRDQLTAQPGDCKLVFLKRGQQ